VEIRAVGWARWWLVGDVAYLFGNNRGEQGRWGSIPALSHPSLSLFHSLLGSEASPQLLHFFGNFRKSPTLPPESHLAPRAVEKQQQLCQHTPLPSPQAP